MQSYPYALRADATEDQEPLYDPELLAQLEELVPEQDDEEEEAPGNSVSDLGAVASMAELCGVRMVRVKEHAASSPFTQRV